MTHAPCSLQHGLFLVWFLIANHSNYTGRGHNVFLVALATQGKKHLHPHFTSEPLVTVGTVKVGISCWPAVSSPG